jgi:hypothetical protein
LTCVGGGVGGVWIAAKQSSSRCMSRRQWLAGPSLHSLSHACKTS